MPSLSLINNVMKVSQYLMFFVPEKYQKPIIGITAVAISASLFAAEQTATVRAKVVDLMSQGLNMIGLKDSSTTANELLTAIDELDEDNPSVIGDIINDLSSLNMTS